RRGSRPTRCRARGAPRRRRRPAAPRRSAAAKWWSSRRRTMQRARGEWSWSPPWRSAIERARGALLTLLGGFARAAAVFAGLRARGARVVLGDHLGERADAHGGAADLVGGGAHLAAARVARRALRDA